MMLSRLVSGPLGFEAILESHQVLIESTLSELTLKISLFSGFPESKPAAYFTWAMLCTICPNIVERLAESRTKPQSQPVYSKVDSLYSAMIE